MVIFWTMDYGCCVFRPENACLSMRSHGRKQSKTFENHEKSIFFIMHTRGSRNAHEEKRRKTKKNEEKSYYIIHMHCSSRKKYKNTKIPNEQQSFKVSTSFWESLPITDQQTFFFIFLCKPLVCLSCAWWKRYYLLIFKCFWLFLTMRTHAQACIRWSKYTTYSIWHNSKQCQL